MPFDSATYAPTIGDALTLDGFRSWLQSLPPSTKIGVFMDIDNCPIARYLKSRGFSDFSVGGNNAWGAGADRVLFPASLHAAQDRAIYDYPDFAAGRAEITAGEYLEAVNS